MHSTLPGPMVRRVVWLYVRKVEAPAGEILYVGRTGDCSSRHTTAPYSRMRRHVRLHEDPERLARVIASPEREQVQRDGRIRRRARIDEMGGRYLRVVVLADGETVHDAFVDRGYKP